MADATKGYPCKCGRVFETAAEFAGHIAKAPDGVTTICVGPFPRRTRKKKQQ